MSHTSSIAYPNMFDVSRNSVAVFHDTRSVMNRTKLLILTEPTELYMNPDFGVGLRRHFWQYNTDNEKAIIGERIKTQLRLHDPCVDVQNTVIISDPEPSGDVRSAQEYNQLHMAVAMKTTFEETVEVKINNGIE